MPVNPVTPVTPCAPVSPGAPVGPRWPVTPCTPVAPCTPVTPCTPVGPSPGIGPLSLLLAMFVLSWRGGELVRAGDFPNLVRGEVQVAEPQDRHVGVAQAREQRQLEPQPARAPDQRAILEPVHDEAGD